MESVIGLVVILGSELTMRNVLLPKQASDIHIGTSLLVEWLILLLLLILWLPMVEGKGLESIGFGGFEWRYLWLSFLAYFLLIVVWTGSGFALKAVGLEGMRSLQPKIKAYHFLTRFGLFFTGTFLEEIFYRGYVIERLTTLTGEIWLAGLVSFLIFTCVHLKFFGLGPTLEVGVISAGLVILYIHERSIWPCILVHGINDAFALLLAPVIPQRR